MKFESQFNRDREQPWAGQPDPRRFDNLTEQVKSQPPKLLQDNESLIEVHPTKLDAQKNLFRDDPQIGGQTNGFQNPVPRVGAKFNNDLITE